MMRVSLMNLGDAPRVFHNRLNRAVVVPSGHVVIADLTPMEIQNLRFGRGETVLVGEPETTEIPLEMQGVVELLAVLEFEGYEKALTKFMSVIPPGHATEIRPSRMQMRRYLQTMVEDFVIKMAHPEKKVHDDEDPKVLEDELQKQNDQAKAPPVHPLEQVKREKNAAVTEEAREPPPPLRVRGAVNSPVARPSKKAARAGRRS